MNVALAVETDIRVVIFGAEDNVGNFAEPDHNPVLLLDDHLAKVFRGTEIGIRDQVH